jgi:hypothetical protein
MEASPSSPPAPGTAAAAAAAAGAGGRSPTSSLASSPHLTNFFGKCSPFLRCTEIRINSFPSYAFVSTLQDIL